MTRCIGIWYFMMTLHHTNHTDTIIPQAQGWWNDGSCPDPDYIAHKLFLKQCKDKH